MKYLPGNVFEFVARNIFTKEYSISHSQTALTSIIETAIIICASCGIGLICGWLGFSPFSAISSKLTGLFDRLSSALWIIVPLTTLVSTLLIRIYRLSLPKPSILVKYAVQMSLVFVIHCLVFASLTLSFFFIYLYGFHLPLDYTDFIFILGGFSISWVLGFITPGAPGGIGVKEAGLISLLSSKYGLDLTVAASALHRLICIGGDLLAYALAIVYLKIKQRRDLVLPR